ncbi:choline dehydrogenase [Sphingomonas sp. AP4-R1]|uniref:GMC family oxidoreductase n=1 Tax=Sphingomonas sp. AP4-R1 TaxID=2735134 RepID=UPI001493D09D|nr:GMC family oxidoreductase N-terminal domain-containing protein [Sphingomonas sp. AP4-R1]QJU58147.1 choline dehydrogenase [Sphingomonas sp. AP4-R1]
MEAYDYIIIGGGSAGCALARGLTDDPQNKVLMLEAGPHANKFWVRTPAGMAKLYFNKLRNWNFYTEPMTMLKDRRMYWPRGKTLGGSSSINGMIFIRGHPGDFDGWRDRGCPGWGYEEVLPYFKQMEHFERGGDPAYRGTGGPLWISDPVIKMKSSEDFIEAATRLQIPLTEDMNGEVHDGVGFMQHTIRHGRRHSAYNAFVEPVLGRANLTVQTDSSVERILFEGREAVGVEILYKGQRRIIQAAREVILSAGSLKSPQLLMVSGVGPEEELRKHGIEVRHELPGVGKNLQDHFYVHTGWRATPDSSYNINITGLRKYWEGFKYLMTHKGFLALGSSQVAAFIKAKPEESYADLQISFRPMTFNYFPNGEVRVESFPGLGVSVFQLRPTATGAVTLASAKASDRPLMTPNFLTTSYDAETMIAGIHKIRQIMSTEPIRSRVVSEEVPGPHVKTEDDIYRYMEVTGNSAQHHTSTCKMGRDELAVVDERLRVHGLGRLRVVDASIMPFVTSGNTNAPTIMIGVKAADMIRQDATPRRPLPPS